MWLGYCVASLQYGMVAVWLVYYMLRLLVGILCG